MFVRLFALLAIACVSRAFAGGSVVVDDGWVLTFEDDFSYFNASIWTAQDNYTHSTYAFTPGDPFPTELQLYTKDSVYVKDGMLVLQTTFQPDRCATYGRNGRNYTSGWVDSSAARSISGKGFAQTFGRFEMRAKLPPGGTFPSIWPVSGFLFFLSFLLRAEI